MKFGNTTNYAKCLLGVKQYKLFYTVQKHEICSFMETLSCETINLNTDTNGRAIFSILLLLLLLLLL